MRAVTALVLLALAALLIAGGVLVRRWPRRHDRPTVPSAEVRARSLAAEDNEDYRWVDPTPASSDADRCVRCHAAISREWAPSAHAQSARNRHFLNLYDGSDWHGRADVGWGLLRQHPDGAGVCTACHAPSVSLDDPAYFDLRQASGVPAQGVHCDYCHKVVDTTLDQLGLTHGRFGLKLLRPKEGQLFFGPFVDAVRADNRFAPVYRESRYCASCHEGTVFGVPVYSTYSEWLESPARHEGKQCQTCHMAPTGKMTYMADEGGIPRNPHTLASHSMPGRQAEMLRRCLSVSAKLSRADDAIQAVVTVHCDQVGHRVPTGFIDRNVVLVVEPRDGAGRLLSAKSGPRLPSSAGRACADLPGRLFAKQLTDFAGHSPAPFWNTPAKMVDTRLQPGQSDVSEFRFPTETQDVRIRLLYRRFWPEVAETKQWPDNEVIVVDRIERVAP
jgi:hypothetical protein